MPNCILEYNPEKVTITSETLICENCHRKGEFSLILSERFDVTHCPHCGESLVIKKNGEKEEVCMA